MATMNALALCLVLALTAAPAQAKERPMSKPQEKISAASQYTVPAGWTASFKTEQGDPQAVLEKDMHVITVRLAGGEGSRYRASADFLVGFEARSPGGKLAEKLGGMAVAGQNVMLYRRKVPVALPPPDASGPSTMTSEEFCVLKAGKLFFILSYSYGDTIPDPTYDGLKAWRGFLRGFKLKK